MKLVIAIVHERDKHKVSDALLEVGHKFTIVASTGGFLRDGNVTFLIGTEDESVDGVIEIVRRWCSSREQYVTQPMPDAIASAGAVVSPVKVCVGGAIIFVVDVEKYERV